MNPTLIRLAGAGRAYQCVAQSTAIAIQDATDYLRNVSTISATAIGVAIAQIAVGNPNGPTLLSNAQKIVGVATTDFSNIATAAITVAADYPQSFE